MTVATAIRPGTRASPPGRSGRPGTRRTAAAARRASTATSRRRCPRSRPARGAASSRRGRPATRAPSRRRRRPAPSATDRSLQFLDAQLLAERAERLPLAGAGDPGVGQGVADAPQRPAVADLGGRHQRLGQTAAAGQVHRHQVEIGADDPPQVARASPPRPAVPRGRAGRRRRPRRASAIQTGMTGPLPKPSVQTMREEERAEDRARPRQQHLGRQEVSQLRSSTARSARSERCSQPCWR